MVRFRNLPGKPFRSPGRGPLRPPARRRSFPSARTARVATAAFFAALGCSFLPRRSAPPEGSIPAQYTTGDPTPIRNHQWWTDFHSDSLSALMNQAMDENLTIRQLWARLEQADSLVIQAAAELYPQVNLLAGADYFRSVTTPRDTSPSFRQQLREAVISGISDGLEQAAGSTGDAAAAGKAVVTHSGGLLGSGGGPIVPGSGSLVGTPLQSVFARALGGSSQSTPGRQVQETRRFGLSLAASYELDIWGRIASQYRAARFEFEATRQDLDAAANTLAAEIADRWLRILEQRELRRILTQQLETNRTYLELVELRFQKGIVSALDVYQQRQVVKEVERQLPLVDAQEQVLRHSLAVLLGRPPAIELEVGAYDLTAVPPLPPVGVPADLLELRPDIRAAMSRLTAADHRVASARAELLPALRLTARIGLNSSRISTFFDDWFLSLASELAQPLFDGFRRMAEVDRALALTEELLAGYRLTVLNAMREVEDALVTESRQRDHLRALAEQLDAARNALREAGQRYQRGLSDYLPVLTALERTQALDRNLVVARRELLVYRINLYRALGGTWTDHLNEPAPLGEEVARAGG